MKGQISKSYKFSTNISCDDLQRLNDFIMSEYSFVKYKITTIDGAEYEIESFDKILNYENHSSRKIDQIFIYANHENKHLRIFNDFEMKLRDLSRFPDSINYSIRNISNNEITYYTSNLNELLENFKSPSSWLHSIWISLVFSWMLLIIFSISFTFFFQDKIDKTFLYLSMLSFSFALGYFLPWVFEKITSFLFPRTIFCIGKQIKYQEKKKSLRHNILYSVIIAFIVGVLVSLFFWSITK